MILYLLDTTEGFGLWLRPAGARYTGRAFVLLFRFARLAFRPSAFFCIFAGSLRLGFRRGVSATLSNLRKIPAQLLVYFHNEHNIAKPLGYCKKIMQLFFI